jgi:hypothetical protein
VTLFKGNERALRERGSGPGRARGRTHVHHPHAAKDGARQGSGHRRTGLA